MNFSIIVFILYSLILFLLYHISSTKKYIVYYESIKNVENIRREFAELNGLFKNLVTENFSYESSLKDVLSLYTKTTLLNESNNLIIYDHFFSDEFKIGMFVPIMVPLVYGLLKALKHLWSKK